ncbi:uncharacterized protein LOC135828398 isoform X2 [Sycon ciliatum]|uniref:uncharacterized protein LOC135828398 isoform X2 n=1 Tax=Sycon ciliatum TaxID=27933 RepID=UPI0031F6B4AD
MPQACATTLPPSTGVAASPPTSVHAPAKVKATPAEAPASAAGATVAAAAVPGTLVPTANLQVDSPLGEMIGQKLLDVKDWKGFSDSLEKCVSRENRDDFAQAVAVLIDPENANDFRDTIQDFIRKNKLGDLDLKDNLFGVMRWAVGQSRKYEVTLADLEKIARDLNPDRKNRIRNTFHVEKW